MLGLDCFHALPAAAADRRPHLEATAVVISAVADFTPPGPFAAGALALDTLTVPSRCVSGAS